MPTPSAPARDDTQSDPGYTAVHAARVARLSRGRLSYLAEQGLVAPSLIRAGGTRPHYTFAQLVELRTIARLTGPGNRVSIGAMRPVVSTLREIDDEQLLSAWLAIADGAAVWTDERSASLTELLRDRPTSLVVNLGLLERDVEQALVREGLHPPRHRPGQRSVT